MYQFNILLVGINAEYFTANGSFLPHAKLNNKSILLGVYGRKEHKRGICSSVYNATAFMIKTYYSSLIIYV